MQSRHVASRFIVCFFASLALILAQSLTGIISGTVADPSKSPVAGAKVTITNADTGVTAWSGTTNESGLYRAPDLPVGHYTLAVDAAGFKREQLLNVRLRRGDAQALVEAAPDGFFSRVFILYPDPWPKRRHRKRRVLAVGMIDALARAMRRGGELRFVTDVDDYAGWTLQRFLASPHFRWTANRADDWRRPWPEWRPTRYEAKARKEGRGSVYLTFARL